jgi:hypothetical protein
MKEHAMETWAEAQERGNREAAERVRATEERAAASARKLAPLRRLAEAIAPGVVVHLGGGNVGRAGDFTYRNRAPIIVVYEINRWTETAYEAAELDAILLHELGHYLLDHMSESGQLAWLSAGSEHLRDVDTQGDAETLAAALAERYAAALNAPLADVLAHLGA